MKDGEVYSRQKNSPDKSVDMKQCGLHSEVTSLEAGWPAEARVAQE